MFCNRPVNRPSVYFARITLTTRELVRTKYPKGDLALTKDGTPSAEGESGEGQRIRKWGRNCSGYKPKDECDVNRNVC